MSSRWQKVSHYVVVIDRFHCSHICCLQVLIITCQQHVACWIINSSPLDNGHHFVDDLFGCIFFTKSLAFLINIHWSLFRRIQLTITQHYLNNALVRIGDKQLSELMLTQLTDIWMRHSGEMRYITCYWESFFVGIIVLYTELWMISMNFISW